VKNIERRIIAVVSDTFDDYQRGIVHWLHGRFARARYGTLCVSARDLHDSDALRSHSAQDCRVNGGGMYRLEGSTSLPGRLTHPLADCLDVSGYVILTPLLGRGFSSVEMTRFVERISARPVVSLGGVLGNLPSVRLASDAALAALMAHMTRDPHRKRFVFLRGYAGEPDSEERETAFRQGLVRAGLSVDESLILDGHFSASDSFAAVDALLRSGERFDALVAANDTMAVSAMIALERHGLGVPSDVLVSGFDDHPVAIDSHPPLTTIRQQLEPQAVAAADLLLDRLAERDVGSRQPIVSIDADLMIRRSSDATWQESEAADWLVDALHSDTPMALLDKHLQLRLRRVYVPDGIAIDRIVSGVFHTLVAGSDALGLMIEEALEQCPVDVHTVRWWMKAVRILKSVRRALPVTLAHADAEVAISRAVDRLENRLGRARATWQFDRMTHRQRHEHLLMRLASCSSHESIWTLLQEGFGSLGLKRAWIALNVDTDVAVAEKVRLAFSFSNERTGEHETNFDTKDVLPQSLHKELESGLLVLSPLTAHELELGYLLIDPRDCLSLELSALTTGLSLALHQVGQRTALKKRADALGLANSALSTVARYDTLTGLPNRAHFHENLELALHDARRTRHEVALLFVDLDGFKLINDTLGHSAGDHLLRVVASRVDRVLRSDDSLSRLGGDEFTVIAVPGPGEKSATRLADSVLDAIAQPCHLGERIVNVSASVGIACFPDDGLDAETLVRNADTAMYHAKVRGKHRHTCYTPVMHHDAIREIELREDMRRGLANDEFRLHYQPRVELPSGRLLGFEALIRWRDDIGPASFIPVAEQCGLISSIDAFSLDSACRQARDWLDRGLMVQVAVNLSVKRLQEPTIVEQLVEALRKHDLSPELLELEITESAAMSDVDDNIEKLGALRALGVRIAIDDFGTGYSSLEYLRRLPVTSLKIDRSFLSGIESALDADSADAAIVRAVVGLGRSLGYRVVAEGVENEAQLDFLNSLGCDEGQGWYFGKPLSVSAATERLQHEYAIEALPGQVDG